MILKELANSSVYGTVGHVSTKEDVDFLEKHYVTYNLPVLKEFGHVLVATNFDNVEVVPYLEAMWRRYFKDCTFINSTTNRGHGIGTADLDDAIFNFCKDNQVEWLCKSSNDMIFRKEVLYKEIGGADFYYFNGIGYTGVYNYDFDLYRIMDENFYPQTTFYFINVSKVDYLNDREHVNETYARIQAADSYNGKLGDYGFRTNETLLKECIERNKLVRENLLPRDKYFKLLNIIKDFRIADCSHKSIMLENICHMQWLAQPIIEIIDL
jgi:hypothetical protein